MSIFNQKKFLEQVEKIKRSSQFIDKFKEFNIFNIIPRRYKREEFHSALLAGLLCKKNNPAHGENLLKLLLETLNEINNDLKLNLEIEDFNNYEVITEKGGIDILIKGKSQSSGFSNSIIIENKINGAPDQPKQLKRYYDERIKKKDKVKAIVYLPLIHRKPKSLNERIQKLLFIFPAYQKNDKNTLIKWCEKAILKIGICETSAILQQYLSYLKFMAKEEIQLREVEQFYDLLLKNNNFEGFKKLKENEKHNILVRYCRNLELEFPRFLASKCSEFLELFDIYNDYGLDKQRDNKRKPNDTWYFKFWNAKKTKKPIPEVIRISFNKKNAIIQLWANVKGTGNIDGIDTFLGTWASETNLNHQFENNPDYGEIGYLRKFNLPFDYPEMKKFINYDLIPALTNKIK